MYLKDIIRGGNLMNNVQMKPKYRVIRKNPNKDNKEEFKARIEELTRQYKKDIDATLIGKH